MIEQLQKRIKGEIYTDEIRRRLYSTDASAYREMPLAVVIPSDKADLQMIIKFAYENETPIIPRGAGTSLAGQVVGSGIVIDLSKNLNKILEINTEKHYAWVEPGVIRDELNLELKKYGLFFGPETSTSNRCTLGGMLGNNACGTHLPVYGTTRDQVLAVKVFLSDGTETVFEQISKTEFEKKCEQNNLEGQIYRNLRNILSDKKNRDIIKKEFPHPDIKRRNTGYAIDLLADTEFFGGKKKFNLAKLIAGSEGTLAVAYAIKLNLHPLPPKHKVLMCIHFETLRQALEANIHILKHKPSAIELMDDKILELTKDNIEQQKNRFFVRGNPAAILIAEFNSDIKDEIISKVKKVESDLRSKGYGYHFPLVWDGETKKVWDLRKAGLGILSNMPGDAKPQPVIEDTAVRVEDLPDYIEEFDEILKRNNLECVYYAHISTGELHLRPLINLKTQQGQQLFRKIAVETAELVKKYGGSLSGEHGDGRLRGEFIPLMIGNHNYDLLKEIKRTFDPKNILNPGKITDTPPMDKNLRYVAGQETKEIQTIFDFSSSGGYLRMVEKCNGSADCRKSSAIGGTMCPSFKATRNEWNATRARANILREFITYGYKPNVFSHKEIYEILDTCLSCKACKAECPSNVDITKLKAEFLQHYYEANGIPCRTRLIANFPTLNKLMSFFPALSNFILNSKVSNFFAYRIGFAKERTIPKVYKPLNKWYKKHNKPTSEKTVYLFNDEFINLNEPDTGIKAILLLEKLGYKVIIPKHIESGRTYLSKGFVKKAKTIINKNIALLKDLINEESPLIGLEPSAILTFRDESLDLVDKSLIGDAKNIAKNSMMFEEFFMREVKAGRIKKQSFTKAKKHIKLHGHCYQKALASTKPTIEMLSFPQNYIVEEIPSGCCGMAGSFGYEAEHYELSMKVGEMILFPAVRQTPEDWEIAAPGISCRHHIAHGTKRKPKHPVEIMYEALL